MRYFALVALLGFVMAFAVGCKSESAPPPELPTEEETKEAVEGADEAIKEGAEKAVDLLEEGTETVEKAVDEATEK